MAKPNKPVINFDGATLVFSFLFEGGNEFSLGIWDSGGQTLYRKTTLDYPANIKPNETFPIHLTKLDLENGGVLRSGETFTAEFIAYDGNDASDATTLNFDLTEKQVAGIKQVILFRKQSEAIQGLEKKLATLLETFEAMKKSGATKEELTKLDNKINEVVAKVEKALHEMPAEISESVLKRLSPTLEKISASLNDRASSTHTHEPDEAAKELAERQVRDLRALQERINDLERRPAPADSSQERPPTKPVKEKTGSELWSVAGLAIVYSFLIFGGILFLYFLVSKVKAEGIRAETEQSSNRGQIMESINAANDAKRELAAAEEKRARAESQLQIELEKAAARTNTPPPPSIVFSVPPTYSFSGISKGATVIVNNGVSNTVNYGYMPTNNVTVITNGVQIILPNPEPEPEKKAEALYQYPSSWVPQTQPVPVVAQPLENVLPPGTYIGSDAVNVIPDGPWNYFGKYYDHRPKGSPGIGPMYIVGRNAYQRAW